MYENNLSPEEFLYSLFMKIEKDLREINTLKEVNNVLNNTKIYEIKKRLLNVFEMLQVLSPDEELKNLYFKYSSLLITNDKGNIDLLLELFSKSRKQIEN